ncbi:hypothetical protein GAY33_05225 [Azospirillum brasilense]|uniref:hypothetical protein n=1 Tax=Azospirillum argentinense TaxID=2970906 RepID=UPI00190A2426|nr:hypothetical protein [Azospirillum argentinense]MBK3798638.1 hypothetical protein [Azospirillum argentinense]
MAARYRVIGPVAKFGPGLVLALTPAQASAREPDLRKHAAISPKGLLAVEVVTAVQFKLGEEVVVLAGAPAKTALQSLVEADEPANGVRPPARRKGGGGSRGDTGGLFPPPANTGGPTGGATPDNGAEPPPDGSRDSMEDGVPTDGPKDSSETGAPTDGSNSAPETGAP